MIEFPENLCRKKAAKAIKVKRKDLKGDLSKKPQILFLLKEYFRKVIFELDGLVDEARFISK